MLEESSEEIFSTLKSAVGLPLFPVRKSFGEPERAVMQDAEARTQPSFRTEGLVLRGYILQRVRATTSRRLTLAVELLSHSETPVSNLIRIGKWSGYYASRARPLRYSVWDGTQAKSHSLLLCDSTLPLHGDRFASLTSWASQHFFLLAESLSRGTSIRSIY